MGVEGILNRGEFDRISSSGAPLKVDDVKHKAIVEVDMEGTVGAAATGEIDLLSQNEFKLNSLKSQHKHKRANPLCTATHENQNRKC